MKIKIFIPLIVAIIVVASVIFVVPTSKSESKDDSILYVGVSFCGNTTVQAKLLIDKIKNYCNLFVLQSLPLSSNQTAIYEVLDYATDSGMNILVNLINGVDRTYWPMQLSVFQNAKQRWGDKFLGAYYGDEPGGLQLDFNWKDFWGMFAEYISSHPEELNRIGYKHLYDEYLKIQNAQVGGAYPKDYELEAQTLQDYFANDTCLSSLRQLGIKTFVSDYGLYWFDYLGGYDVVLTQFGANNSIYQDIALTRGAANMQNKEWGAFITWKYDSIPYLDSGEEIYKQMTLAYQAGAEYIIIFDYPYFNDNPYGVLKDEHFNALEKFSKDLVINSNTHPLVKKSTANSALVLPRNYGWGMRWNDDVIWGYWGPDDNSPQIWNITQSLLTLFGIHIDIVYDDSAFPVAGKYSNIYYWNETL
jgi:hypothetical protein